MLPSGAGFGPPLYVCNTIFSQEMDWASVWLEEKRSRAAMGTLVRMLPKYYLEELRNRRGRLWKVGTSVKGGYSFKPVTV